MFGANFLYFTSKISNMHAMYYLSDTSRRRGGSYAGWTDQHTPSVAFAVSVCE